MNRPRLSALAALALAGAAAGNALADEPNSGHLIVPVDHVLPGETFRITGFEIDAGIDLSLQLTSGGTTVELGSAHVALDGTVEASGGVPANFPLGYAELHAVSQADGTWTAVVLIGERAEGPQAIYPDGPFIDVQLMAVLMIGVGLVVFVGASSRYLRGRQRETSRPD